MRSRRAVILVISFLLLLVVGAGYFAYTNNLIPFLRTASGTIASSDGSIELRIPDGAQSPGARITFTPDPSAAQALNLTARGFSALGTPVDISVTNGTLAAKRVLVTMKYNPPSLPKGVTPTNLGMAVFDPNFDAWMPIGSAVNPQTHTVSAIAPHFSVFSVIFLDPAKRLAHVGNIAISTVINGTTTISQWFTDLLNQLLVATFKDLFGIAPTLTCSPSSPNLIIEAKSILNRLTACAEPTTGGDNRLSVRNGYGFPLRINVFPSGFTQRVSDIFTNGSSDLLNLLRNVYFHFRRQAVLPGADLGSLTVTSAQQGTSTLSLNLDALSIAEDVGLTTLLLFVPAGKVADAYGEAGVKAALQTIFSVGIGKEGASSAGAWIQRGFDILDCTNTLAHNLPVSANPFSRENVDRLVEVGRSCVSSIMDKFNLDSVLIDILGSLKVVPSIVEASVAEALNKGLPPGFNPNTTAYSIAVTRFNFTSFVGTWHVHGYDLTIRSNYTGTDVWHDGFTASGAWCNGYDNIAFTPLANGSLLGVIQATWYTPSGGQCTQGGWAPGDQFTLTHQGSHLLYEQWQGPNLSQNSGYLCDAYASGQGWNQCGA